ncbi:hypothetical protein Scep_006987 [Stephania cephalantha]|uniref:Reverse transcriptase zinc-binding domain-containing protein n=1 Tax=Stephania cephalantha TaxID=152367 RepID=A0AAP0KBP7_9MAGN
MGSVNSVYRVALNLKEGSNFQRVDGNWKLVWNLSIPLKVKHFLWSLLRNCIPAKKKLKDRGMQITTMCTACDAYEESLPHLFLQCRRICSSWNGVIPIPWIDNRFNFTY